MMESSGPSSSLLHEQYYFNNSFQEEAPANSPRRMEEHVGNNTNNIGGGRLKAHVLWHPLFAQVLASHVACLRIATPVDHLPSIDAQLPHSHKSLSIKYPPPLHTPNIINNNNNHNQDELNQFMAHYVLVLSSFKEQLQQHVRVHAMEAVMACWELERTLLGLTGVSLGVGTNATMSDDEDKDPLSSYSDDDLYDMKGSNSYREGLGPLILSDIERSLMEHVRCELKEELKMGYKSRIVDVREEILRKRRVGKLPSDTTTILKAWWQVHAKWPYPTEEEKDQLVQETGLQLKQINNWFINQRKRKWHTSSSSTMKRLNWNSTPNKLPIWWDAHANPIAWAPRWIGLLILPVLQIVISYILYQLAARDPYLTTQSGGSANALANIIALPSIFLFMIFNLVHLPIARSVTQNFLPRIFVVNVAIWMLCWLGYNLQFVEPNSSIGVMGYCPITESSLWDRQHKRAGIILMTLGTLLFIVSLICPTGIAFLVITLVIWLGAYFVVLFDSYLVSMTYVEAKKLVDSPNTFKNRDITQSKSLKRPLI